MNPSKFEVARKALAVGVVMIHIKSGLSHLI